MLQFALPQPTAMKVLNVNIRSELHGKVHVPAVDLKLELTASNTMLDQLKGPALRQALYMGAEWVAYEAVSRKPYRVLAWERIK